MGGITLSDNGSVIAGRVVVDGNYVPARIKAGKRMELLPDAGNTACEHGEGIVETYSNFAISPNGETLGGFLWACDNDPNYDNYTAMAATYSDDDGWTILNDQTDSLSSRVNSLSDNGVAVGWAEQPTGWWEDRVWKDGEEINLKLVAPANVVDVGEATAVSSDGVWVVGLDAWNDASNNTRTATTQNPGRSRSSRSANLVLPSTGSVSARSPSTLTTSQTTARSSAPWARGQCPGDDRRRGARR